MALVTTRMADLRRWRGASVKKREESHKRAEAKGDVARLWPVGPKGFAFGWRW